MRRNLTLGILLDRAMSPSESKISTSGKPWSFCLVSKKKKKKEKKKTNIELPAHFKYNFIGKLSSYSTFVCLSCSPFVFLVCNVR